MELKSINWVLLANLSYKKNKNPNYDGPDMITGSKYSDEVIQAVKCFQRDYSLAVDGDAGEITRHFMGKAIIKDMKTLPYALWIAEPK